MLEDKGKVMKRISIIIPVLIFMVALLLVSMAVAQEVDGGTAAVTQPADQPGAAGQTAGGTAEGQSISGGACAIGIWQTVTPVNTGRSRPGLAYLAATGNFYLAGGEASGSSYDNPIEEYDPVANTWTDRTSLLTGVSNTGAVGVGAYVYVPGGFSGAGSIADMQRFDPAANTVVTMTAMPAANYAHAVTALDGRIHVLGGSDTGAAGTTHYIYDIDSDTWITGTALLTAVNYAAAASDGTYVYVLGGTTSDLATVQRYHPQTGTWDTIADMNNGRGGPGAFFDGANLWAVGGGWSTYLASTEYWDGAGWQVGPPMNVGLRTGGAAFGGGLALRAAGWNDAYDNSAEILNIVCLPIIVVAEDELSSSQPPGQVLTLTLTISNTGPGTLNWQIFEEAPAAPVSAPASSYETGSYAPSAGAIPTVERPQNQQPMLRIPLGAAAYSVETANGFFTAFDLDVPETLPNLAPYAAAGFPGAGEVVNGYVYMIGGNTMIQIDPVTGGSVSTTPVTPAPGGHTYSGMALDQTSGTIYVSSCDIATSILYTLDLDSGTLSQIGPITDSPCTIAIAIDGNGDLWGYDIFDDTFLSIDKTTAVATTVGPIGFDANFGQGMAYDPATDTLYMAAFNDDAFRAELRSVDTSTGNTTLVGVLGATSPGGLVQLPWLGVEMGEEACLPDDLPWLSVNPITGTVAAGEAQAVTVSLDSTGLLPGTSYNGILCLDSDDRSKPQVRVPVTLNVENHLIYLPIVLKP